MALGFAVVRQGLREGGGGEEGKGRGRLWSIYCTEGFQPVLTILELDPFSSLHKL